MSRGPDPKSASGFIRSQPVSMSVAAVVAKAKAEGIKLSNALVYKVRGKMGGKPAQRGPGRPAKVASKHEVGNGLEAAIEAIVEHAVERLLRQRLGALLGR